MVFRNKRFTYMRDRIQMYEIQKGVCMKIINETGNLGEIPAYDYGRVLPFNNTNTGRQF